MICTPFDVAKVRMQNDFSKIYRGIGDCLKKTWKGEGFVNGFYKGSSPNVYRAIIVNGAELGTYDSAKWGLVYKFGMSATSSLTHLLCSLSAGLVSTICSSPIDVVKTRYMGTTHLNLYSSPLDCAMKIVKNEGFFALYNGVLALYMRLGVWTLVFFMSYEQYTMFTKDKWANYLDKKS